MTNYLQEGETSQRRTRTTITSLAEQRRNGEKIAMLTCYDASYAALMNQCGVEALLIGDSLGMVCQPSKQWSPRLPSSRRRDRFRLSALGSRLSEHRD